jgi:ketosteroid isomerase-like protein
MRTPVAVFLASIFVAGSLQAAPVAKQRIADTIKSDVAQLIAGINAHDVDKATQFDAPDIVSMEAGRPPSVGAAADKEGLGMAFKYTPSWQVRLVDETVDVADAGDMAIYRSTYYQDSAANGTPMTQKVNFVAGFRRQPDGSWKIAWSVVAAQERPHKK